MDPRFKKISISKEVSIQEALKLMDKSSVRLLLVFCEDKFVSLLSIGDIQRAIIANFDLGSPIKNILRKEVVVANVEEDVGKLKKRMLFNRYEFMPIIDLENNLADVIFWDDLFEDTDRRIEKIDLPVIIMAGGKGTRMKPITNVLPKPLIPIDDKTIIEHIINNFTKIGCLSFYVSINYKAKMIRDYFDEIDKNYGIDFFEEDTPLGTAGSLHLLNGKIKSPFFISNCDILINEDYSEIYKYHQNYKNELTIVGSFRNYPIPYGTLETEEEGRLISLQEKPELSFLINSGMYILEPHLIAEVPENTFYHITDLIEKILARNGRVGVFPVSEKSWIDVGEWDKYLKMINEYK